MGLTGQATGGRRGPSGGGRARFRLACLGLTALWCAGACDADPIGARDLADAAVSADAPVEIEVIADAPGDEAGSGDLPGDAVAAPAFSTGINPAGVHSPAAFTALGDGDDMWIELGGQGLWMVVAAFRTHGVLTSPVTIEATLVADDTVLASLGLAGQALAREADGLDYYYDLFMVVDSARLSGVDGQAATLTLRVSDGDGQVQTAATTVHLRGGPAATGGLP
jgi:hypothetical protein